MLFFAVVWAKLYRRALIAENGVAFPEERPIGEDAAFNIQFFTGIKTIEVTDRAYYFYCGDNKQSLTCQYHHDSLGRVRREVGELRQMRLGLENSTAMVISINNTYFYCVAKAAFADFSNARCAYDRMKIIHDFLSDQIFASEQWPVSFDSIPKAALIFVIRHRLRRLTYGLFSLRLLQCRSIAAVKRFFIAFRATSIERLRQQKGA